MNGNKFSHSKLSAVVSTISPDPAGVPILALAAEAAEIRARDRRRGRKDIMCSLRKCVLVMALHVNNAIHFSFNQATAKNVHVRGGIGSMWPNMRLHLKDIMSRVFLSVDDCPELGYID